MDVLDSIKGHAELKPGWHNGRGGPLSAAVVQRGLQLCYGILDAGYSLDDLEDFPLEDGRLEIVCYSGIDYQFIISTDQLVRVTTIDQGKHVKVATRLTVTAAVELFKQREKWPTFAFFTSEILAENVVTSVATALSHPWTGSFQSCMHNAFENQQGTYAIMVGDFTPPLLPGTPSYFSNYNLRSFHPIRASNKKRRKTAISATTTYRGVTPKTPELLEMRSQENIWREFASVKTPEIFQLPTITSAKSGMITTKK